MHAEHEKGADVLNGASYPSPEHQPPLNPEEVLNLLDSFRETVVKQGLQVATLSAYSEDGSTGAGHQRQGRMMHEALEKAGVDAIYQTVSLPQELGGRFYADVLQRNPWFYNAFVKVIGLPVFAGLIETSVRQRNHVDLVRAALNEAHVDSKRPLIAVTTYGTVAEGIARLFNSGEYHGLLVECVPDPYELYGLQVSTSRIHTKMHVVTVHDEKTRLRYINLRGNDIPVWPLGTISPVSELLEPQPTQDGPLRIGIEFSGNENRRYTDRIIQFIESVAEQIKKW
ncbi:hypothetical protein C4579_02415 [Candidatus Microgenomates bacterium]|nr:MAG: hypothetical protein C4579_02415 [Candidatus Microgenomates bacterium]